MSSFAQPARSSPLGWYSLGPLLSARKPLGSLLMVCALGVLLTGTASGMGAALRDLFGMGAFPAPTAVSLGLAAGLPAAAALYLTEVLTEAQKRPAVRLQPRLGADQQRASLVLGVLLVLVAVALALFFENRVSEFTRRIESFSLGNSVPPLRTSHPLEFLGIATLSLGLGAWCGQNRSSLVTALALAVWGLLVCFQVPILYGVEGSPLWLIGAGGAGLYLAAQRWSPGAIAEGARSRSLGLFDASVFRPYESNGEAKTLRIPPSLSGMSRAVDWKAAARFEFKPVTPFERLGPVLRIVSIALVLPAFYWFAHAALTDQGFLWALSDSVLVSVLGASSAANALDASDSLASVWPFGRRALPAIGLIQTCTVVAYRSCTAVNPLSYRQLYPISRDERARFGLRHFRMELLKDLGLVSALYALALVPALLYLQPKLQVGFPRLPLILLFALSIAPWFAMAGPFLGPRSLRAGKPAGLRILFGTLVMFGLGMAVPLALLGLPAWVWLGLSAASAGAGWPLLHARVHRAARADCPLS